MSTQEPILTRAGQHLHLLNDALKRLDDAGKAQSPEHDGLFRRRERIIDIAMANSASNLRDAAVLVMMISDRANDLEVFTFPAEHTQGIGKAISMAASAILETLGSVGVRLDDIGPIDALYEIERQRRDRISVVTLVREVTA